MMKQSYAPPLINGGVKGYNFEPKIDVKKTSDGHLVIIHDSSLDRTTNGSGSVSSKTLAEIKQLYLYDSFGNLTEQKVPTLKEVMGLAKDNIIVMIDKANDFFEQTHEVLIETGTVQQALFLEFYDYHEAISVMSKNLFENSLYVPRIKESKTKKEEYITPFISNDAAHAIEIRFSTINSHTLEVIPQIKEAKVSIWITTLSNSFSAGYTDQISLSSPHLGWGKCIELGANIIMTDYPEKLINYLKNNNLH